MTFRIAAFATFIAVSAPHLWAEGPRDVAFRYKVDPLSASVLSRRAIHVFLRGNRPDLTLTDVTLEPNVVLANARPDLREHFRGRNVTEAQDITEYTEVHLGDGKREVELLFEYPKGSWWMPLRDFALSTLEPGVQNVVFKSTVQTPTEALDPLNEPVDLNITAPTLSITLAGAAGALTLALLRLVYRLRGTDSKRSVGVEAREAVIAICAGGLIAFTLTYLGGIVSGSQFGIEIAATSWKGGFIIGLFSYKLGDVLAQKLWGTPTP